MTLAQVVSEGNRVATRIKLEGTHRGNFFGFEPTDKFVSFGGMQFSRIENGKLTESWEIVDMAGVAQQLSS
jgi:predicted ester cyclase